MPQYINIIVYIFLAIVSALGDTKPQWEPPGFWGRDISAGFTVEKDMIPSLTIGSFNVILGQTHLYEASNRLNATIGHAGEGGEEESWVCLQGQDQNVPWALWLRSGDIDNDIDGKVIGGFLFLRRSANDNLDSRCRRVKDFRVALPIPLRLGMSRKQVDAILGPPTSQSEIHMFYSHHSRVTRCLKRQDTSGPCDLVSQLYIRFDGNKVDGIQVWHFTT